MATEKKEPKGTAKRDTLLEIEAEMQKYWEENKVFEANAPKEGEPVPPKFMATFPFPYMNGRLHLGHSFSLSKVEFAIGYERLKGKRTLFPFGFHCTGMPIKACADKLKNEIEMFGQNFEKYYEQNSGNDSKEEESGVKAKHSKVAAKSGNHKYQFQTMLSLGIPIEEIHKFADPIYWLYYFPPRAIDDLKHFGAKVDWRRSFITTDVNPYYDSFVRWQFNRLKNHEKPKIKFGERYTVYSIKDGQACMDHDRSTGEGVGVQEYTGIKLEILQDEITKPANEKDTYDGVPVGDLLAKNIDKFGGRKLYMVAATLRPETMYGQTNCFVGIDIDYGVYQVNDKECWICTERAAKNMAYQGLFEKRGEIIKLLDLKGSDLVGVPLKAPLTSYEKVYTLPMEGVSPKKGTGVVTSVPSDAPADYITLADLKKKHEYYKINLKWVENYEPIPIIKTPNFGDLAAKTACEKLKIRSQKDKQQLETAKEQVYKEGFYSGTLIVGKYAGKPVQEAKNIIKKEMVEQGLAITYCEPEGLVISRSGDECIVSLMDQWFLDYGEPTWKAQAEKCLAQMNTFGEETRNAFQKTLDWLNQWACSRSFGLGTRLPWDPQYLIESLSDSTIYMAYYTVAHMLQYGALDGSKVGLAGIKPEQLTEPVWDYIYMDDAPFPETDIPKETLDNIKREFQYFYPLDLRCSGKDLVTNHLTFFIYNHVALFPEKYWPKGVRSNGHLLLNSEKMSKSTGNFITLSEAIKKFSADATRIALADAGDTMDDANFVEDNANAAVLRLYTQKEWMEEVIKGIEEGKFRDGEYNFNDKVFENEMNKFILAADNAYQNMYYRDALKYSFFELQSSRDRYRDACATDKMHKELLSRFIEVQALLLEPIATHFSEYIWRVLLKKEGTVTSAKFPEISKPVDESILHASSYVRDLIRDIRVDEQNAQKKKGKKGQTVNLTSKNAKLFVALKYPEWQDESVAILKECWDEESKSFVKNEKEILAKKGLLKNKKVMPFVAALKKNVINNGSHAFDRRLDFEEMEVLEENKNLILRALNLETLTVVNTHDVTEENSTPEEVRKASMAVPGKPMFVRV